MKTIKKNFLVFSLGSLALILFAMSQIMFFNQVAFGGTDNGVTSKSRFAWGPAEFVSESGTLKMWAQLIDSYIVTGDWEITYDARKDFNERARYYNRKSADFGWSSWPKGIELPPKRFKLYPIPEDKVPTDNVT